MRQAKRFRQMLSSEEVIVAPGAHDAIAARAAQQCGFMSVYMTGNGAMASLIGKPDLGLATMTEMVMRARQLAACLDIPLISDADTGYGELGNVRRTVREFEQAGVAAIHIEDQVSPKRCGALGGIQVVSDKEAYDRIATACDSRQDKDFTIIARTDARMVGDDGLSASLHRIALFEKAGADVVMVEGLQNMEEIKAVVNATSLPVLYNIYEDKLEHAYNVDELTAAGVKIIINCLTSSFLVAKKMLELYTALKEKGTTKGFLPELLTMAEYTHLLGIGQEQDI